jgi:hypothetical protein
MREFNYPLRLPNVNSLHDSYACSMLFVFVIRHKQPSWKEAAAPITEIVKQDS